MNDDDALGFVAAMHEESTRQLAQLRVTLTERVRITSDMAEALAGSPGGVRYASAANAYRDVLGLLGPEPAWSTDNEGNPF